MIKTWILRSLGIVILAYILIKADWDRIGSVFAQGNWWFLLAAIAINLPQLWLKSLRWATLLHIQNCHIRKVDAFLFYLSSLYLGLITPGRIGEFAKALYLKQKRITTLAHGLSSTIADRLLDLLLLILVATYGLIVLSPWKGADIIGWFWLCITLFISIAFLINPNTFRKLLPFFRRIVLRFTKKSQNYLEKDFITGFEQLINRRIWYPFALTAASFALVLVQCYCIARAFSVTLSYFELAQIMAIVNLVIIIPVTISGLGTREATLLFLLSPYGYQKETILAFSMGVFFVFFVVGGLIGAVAWYIKPVPLSELWAVKKRTQS